MVDYSTFLNEVEDLLITEALQPWQDQARDSWMPWTASEELKARWIEMIISGKNDVARAAGFLALGRAAELDTNQQRLLATFYLGYEISAGHLNFFGMLLLINPWIGDIRVRFRQELSNPWVAAAFVSTLQTAEALALDLDDQLIRLSAFLIPDLSLLNGSQIPPTLNRRTRLTAAPAIKRLVQKCSRKPTGGSFCETISSLASPTVLKEKLLPSFAAKSKR